MPLFVVRDEHQLPRTDVRVVYGSPNLTERLLGLLPHLRYQPPLRKVRGRPHRYEIIMDAPQEWETRRPEALRNWEYEHVLYRAQKAGLESVVIPLRTHLPGFLVSGAIVQEATEAIRNYLEKHPWSDKELWVWLLLPEGTPTGLDQERLAASELMADTSGSMSAGTEPADEQAFWDDLHQRLEARADANKPSTETDEKPRVSDYGGSRFCADREPLQDSISRLERTIEALLHERNRISDLLRDEHNEQQDVSAAQTILQNLDDVLRRRQDELSRMHQAMQELEALDADGWVADAFEPEEQNEPDLQRTMPLPVVQEGLTVSSGAGLKQHMLPMGPAAAKPDNRMSGRQIVLPQPAPPPDVPAAFGKKRKGKRKGGSLLGGLFGMHETAPFAPPENLSGYQRRADRTDAPDWNAARESVFGTTGGWDMAGLQADMRMPPRPTGAVYSELDALLDALEESFYDMLFRLIDERHMTDADCYNRANVDRRAFAKLRSNRERIPRKTTVAAFAIALKLDWETALELLAKAGYSMTRANKFDVIVRYCIDQKIYDVDRANMLLLDYKQPLLGSSLNDRAT